jgi:hypothetical protein
MCCSNDKLVKIYEFLMQEETAEREQEREPKFGQAHAATQNSTMSLEKSKKQML